MTLIEELIEKAAKNPKRVALPECEADNTLLVAKRVLETGIGIPVLVSDPAVIAETAARVNVSTEGMEIVDINDEERRQVLIAKFLEQPRNLSEKGANRKTKNPMYYAMMLEAVGEVDCTFCGHTNTTTDVSLAAMSVIGMKEGVDVMSIFSLTEIPGFDGPEGNRIVLADCAINPDPDADGLASIAIATADDIRAMMGWEPRVAFISSSTLGSGESPSTEKIYAAIEKIKIIRPDLKVDGEFQLDTAINPAVAAKKVQRESEVAGRANILIFPSLDAANIGIKMVQIFAKGAGYGHTLSGFAKPVADSSRGSKVEEMLGDIAMVILSSTR